VTNASRKATTVQLQRVKPSHSLVHNSQISSSQNGCNLGSGGWLITHTGKGDVMYSAGSAVPPQSLAACLHLQAAYRSPGSLPASLNWCQYIFLHARCNACRPALPCCQACKIVHGVDAGSPATQHAGQIWADPRQQESCKRHMVAAGKRQAVTCLGASFQISLQCSQASQLCNALLLDLCLQAACLCHILSQRTESCLSKSSVDSRLSTSVGRAALAPQMERMQSFKTLALMSETGSTCCRNVDCRAVIVSPGLADAAALLAPLSFAAFRALSRTSGALRFCPTSASLVRLCAIRPRPGRAARPPRLPAMTHCKARFAVPLQYRHRY